MSDAAESIAPEALHPVPARVHEGERLRRWRMVLGAGDAEHPDGTGIDLEGQDRQMDACLSALYDAPPPGSQRGRSAKRTGNLGSSAPSICLLYTSPSPRDS